MMTQRDRDRLVVLKKALKRLITQREAAYELQATERHVRRLLRAKGPADSSFRRRWQICLPLSRFQLILPPVWPAFTCRDGNRVRLAYRLNPIQEPAVGPQLEQQRFASLARGQRMENRDTIPLF
jgi:hypothetical protein